MTHGQIRHFSPNYVNPHSKTLQFVPGQVRLDASDMSTSIRMSIVLRSPNFCLKPSRPAKL